MSDSLIPERPPIVPKWLIALLILLALLVLAYSLKQLFGRG
jgi:hypothetical protein